MLWSTLKSRLSNSDTKSHAMRDDGFEHTTHELSVILRLCPGSMSPEVLYPSPAAQATVLRTSRTFMVWWAAGLAAASEPECCRGGAHGDEEGV